MTIHRTLLANMSQSRLRSLHKLAKNIDDDRSISQFMVCKPPAEPSWHNVKATRITKKEYRRIFTKAAWVHHVWDRGKPAARKHLEITRSHIDDPRFCVRVIHEIQDLELRTRWMIARCNNEKLPRVTPEVKRLFEKEFNLSYPKRVSDIENDDTQMQEYQGLPDSKMVVAVG